MCLGLLLVVGAAGPAHSTTFHGGRLNGAGVLVDVECVASFFMT